MGVHQDPTSYFLLGVLAGTFWFFKGFGLYRRYRLLADTPVIPIRSAAMGLVEVHGIVCDGKLIPSPVCDIPCYYCKVKIEVWAVDANGNGSWRYLATGTRGSAFYLQDETGKILVDPAHSEMDSPESCQRVAGRVVPIHPHPPSPPGEQQFLTLFPKPPGREASPAPSDEKLLEFVRSVLSGTAAQEDLRGMYRLTEYSILPGQALSISGTCCENPSPHGPEDHSLLRKGENDPTFLISIRSEKDLLMNLRKRALWRILGGSLLAVASMALLLLRLGWLTQ